MRGKSPEETAMDIVIEDGSCVSTVYFLMGEDNVRKQMTVPWVSFASDAESLAPEGPFLKSNPHPRAYGTFARALGKYARDEKVAPLEDIVRRLTSLPATNMQLKRRGSLKPGYFADVAIFDPAYGPRVDSARLGIAVPLRLVGQPTTVEQRFGTYRLQPTATLPTWEPANARPASPDGVGGTIKIASMNVLNFFTTLDTNPGSGNGPDICGPSLLECRGASTTFGTVCSATSSG